ncbi:MAG: hypothetical protein AMXMBFR58_25600 [Phycisphaerae bacterium]
MSRLTILSLSITALNLACAQVHGQFAGSIVYPATSPLWPGAKLFALNATTGDRWEITLPIYLDIIQEPDFSRNGLWLSFHGGPSGNAQIYRVRPDGTQFSQVTMVAGDNTDPSFSPDAQQVLFHKGGNMSVTQVDGAGLVDLGKSGSYSHWSPGGTKIVYSNWPSYPSDLFVYDLITRTTTQLTHNDLAGSGAAARASWSPDGQRLAVSRVEQLGDPWDIWVMNADGSGAVNLTADCPDSSEVAGAWSPGGDYIVYVSNAGGDPEVQDLWSMRADDGSEKTNLTNTPDINEGGPPAVGPIEPACPADFDWSGFVDTDDFDAFVRAFEAGC